MIGNPVGDDADDAVGKSRKGYRMDISEGQPEWAVIPPRDYSIKTGLWRVYDKGDCVWADPDDRAEYDEFFDFLSDRIILVGGKDIWMRDRELQGWRCLGGKSNAKPTLYTTWAGVHEGRYGLLRINKAVIDEYLSVALLSVDDVIFLPGAPSLIIWGGGKRLNVFRDERRSGDRRHKEAALEVYNVLRHGVFGYDGAPELESVDEHIAEINRADSVYSWGMQWLAAKWRNPSFTPLTNLWLIGEVRGVGKSTFAGIAERLLGGNAVGIAKSSEVQKGWTTFLLGKMFITWDEFNGLTWGQLSDFIKETTANEKVAITTRNIGLSQHPNIAIHLFMTNRDVPIRIEKFDRQNTLVTTARDKAGEWRRRAKRLWTGGDENNLTNEEIVLPGFIAALAEVEIDYDFIRKPFKTAKLEQLKAEFNEAFLDWYESLDEEAFRSWGYEELHLAYCDFVRHHCKVQPDPIKTFYRKLKTIDPPLVERGNTGRYRFWTLLDRREEMGLLDED